MNNLRGLRKADNEDGFTLIELMIVVVIIGILAAIAIPVFIEQRVNAINASLQADVKNTNGNIVSVMSQMPTKGYIEGTATGSNGSYGLYKKQTDADPAYTGKIIISDRSTTIEVEGNWDDYTIVGTNVATGAEFTYDSDTGKTKLTLKVV